MPKNPKDVKPPSRRDNVYRPPDSSEASGASAASTSKMAEYQTPQQEHTRPPDDTTLKKPKSYRKSILQQDIDDDDLIADEAPRITKARETFNDIPDPTPAEIGRMLSSRLDYVQSRHARHFDEMDTRYMYNFEQLEKRISVNNNVQSVRMQEMVTSSVDQLRDQIDNLTTITSDIVKTLKTDRAPSPVLRKPLKRDNAPIDSGDDESDEDGGSILLRRRGTRAGRLTRDHQKPNRHPRFEDLEDRHHRPPSPLIFPPADFPQDTPLPRHPTVPVSPPPKPDRLRSQSAMTTSSSSDSSFKVQEIGFFHPALQIDDKNPEGPFVTTGKDVVYRDVNMFVSAAKRIAKKKTSDVVASHLQLCLRGSALTWFSTLKESMQGALNEDLNLFCEKLFAKYKLRPSQALDKLHEERFTMADAARNRHADEYVQNVVLFGSQCGMTAEASLAMAWKNLDPEIQRDVRRPNDSIDEFSQDLDEAVEYWFLRKTHDKTTVQDSGYSSPDAVEAGYQRGLRAGERRASSNQSFNQRPYSNQQQQQRQPYGSQQYRPQGNYQGPRNRDRFRPDTHHADFGESEEFAEEDPELPPESEVFFNDSAWERRDGNQTTPPFACKKCVRRFRDGDELRDHLMNAHGVDPRASSYSHHINADVYPPTAKGFAIITAGMPDGQPKDVCVDTGSSISLIDAAFAKELYLDMQYTRMMHLRGIGNQRTTTYVKFPIYIAGIEVWVTAYVIYVKSIRIILGMDTLRTNQMDVLTSKDVLKIKDKEVPLRYSAALTNEQSPQGGEPTTNI